VSDVLLSVDDLSVDYRRLRRTRRVVDDVSFEVRRGRTLGLVGESGSGKSTIGNAILGLVPAASGTIRFDGADVTRINGRRRRDLTRHIQVVFQDPYGSLNPSRSIGATLADGLSVGERIEAQEIPRRVADALEAVGMPAAAASRYPSEFSGGQRQRIAIARALISSPRLIVCDEAVSALDLSVQAQVLNLLADLQRDRGLSYLFITHDLAVVAHIADDIAVLEQGRIVEHGSTGRVIDDPVHPYTRMLLAAAPVPDPEVQRRRRQDFREQRRLYLDTNTETDVVRTTLAASRHAR
jgi:ABC-type oligopeptide transport system ATPase subunit